MKKTPENEAQASLLPPGRKIGTKSEYARHRDCSPSAVTRALAEGRITTIKVNGRDLIDFEAADAAWSVSTRPRIDAHPPPPRGSRQDDATATARDELRDLRIARERLAVEKAAMELDIRAGLLCERSEVDFVLADVGTRLLAAFEGLPDRLAPLLFGLATMGAMHNALETGLRTVLDDFADSLSRAARTLNAAAQTYEPEDGSPPHG
ncbi:hypothetical protein [uncultured Thiodictyon sp.]|uniref:hypothetical protein n=1 Tax=uncultured Thiodictyon sp. TaxID=1846217 RepID=UPI0025F168E4|nr:hypothetical protein [uncultured Thiodictyon sp.]